VVMREVLLSRVEELLLGIACESRPAFAVCNPAGPFGDRGHSSSTLRLCLRSTGPNAPRPAFVAPATTPGTKPKLRWRYVSRTLTDVGTVSERSRIQLCGRLSVEIDGVELAGSLRGRQVPLLLAYLVLNRDRVVGREELIGSLWPDNAPRSQDAALRTLLSRLRSSLGASVLVGRDELMLELPAPTWVDVEAAGYEVGRAREALHRGDARAAWALAQVPLNIASRGLLPGAQAHWIETRRRELSDLRLQALEILGRAGLSLGGTQLGSAERAARTLIEAEPYRESGYVILMQALQQQGNVAEGLRVFDRLRTLLRDELGTLPSPDALTIHQRLLHPPGGSMPAGEAPQPAGAPAVELPAELGARRQGRLVGRSGELAQIERWAAGLAAPEASRAGLRERLLLLRGDPGVGKTRLLAEVAARAHAAGSLVLAGRAPEQTLVPFQPFVEALGHYVSSAPLLELRNTAREHGVELIRLLPELRRRLPDLPPGEPGNPETERYRLFEAVVGLLGDVSRSMPVMVVLEDLQWADRPTLLLLRHLARAPKAGRILVLGAYRSTERWSESFEAALTGLRRDRLMTEMDLAGLPEADAIELIALRAGGTPSREFARALYEETEGNPFFIEEIVRHLSDSGVEPQTAGASDLQRFGLPDDVREVISRRLARLDADAIEWLRVAAVIGRDFDVSLLERVLGFEEDRFLAVLDEALAAELVAEAPADPGHYSFSHMLIRETLYEGMSATRRARMHRRVGAALEATGSDHLAALAYHFTRAADPEDSERAIRYALEAGEEAARMLAHEQAADYYAEALEVLARFDPEARRRRCDLLLTLGEAQIRSGERPRGWVTFREAAALAADLGDGISLARAAIGASRRFIQPPGVVDAELIGLLEQALRIMPDAPSVTRVELLTRLCGALYYSDRNEQMKRLSAQATVIAAELGDRRAEALAAAARRRAYWGPGHLERRLADSTQLLQAARDAGDLDLMLQGNGWLAVDLLESGDLAGVDAQIEAFTAGAQELRQPLFLWNAAVWRAMRALLAGQLERADALATEALSSGIRPEGITAPIYYAIQLLAIRREQLRMSELETSLRDLIASNPVRPAWRAALAALLCETDRWEQAAEELEVLAAQGFADIPPDGDWMIAMTLLADVATELGDAERAARLYELLLPYGRGNVVIGLGAVCLGASARYLGRLATTMGEEAEAVQLLERAIERNTLLKAPILIAHSQLDYAVALHGGRQARALIEAAQRAARELDLPLVARRAEQLISQPSY
jgi:DNA-binding SARP family transcriptional activator